MKHSGKAFRAATRLIFWTLVLLCGVFAIGVLATVMGAAITAGASVLISLWILFALFTLYFFRDPTARPPAIPNAIVSPAHGKVDLIDETDEPIVMGGRCKRISIFLSVFNVHVQNAPVNGKVTYMKQTAGKFLSATRSDCGAHNENLLLGIDCTDAPGQKVGIRLIAGLIARRILPWIEVGETITRGDRISLIQYGSRCEIYLPETAKVHVRLGDKVKGGETLVASWE